MGLSKQSSSVECKKVHYRLVYDAQFEINRMNIESIKAGLGVDSFLQPYKCKKCKYYHIGHNFKAIKGDGAKIRKINRLKKLKSKTATEQKEIRMENALSMPLKVSRKWKLSNK